MNIINSLKNDGFAVIKNVNGDERSLIESLEKDFDIRKNDTKFAHDSFDKILRISNIKSNNNSIGFFSNTLLDWHYDGLFLEDRENVVALYCKSPGVSSTHIWSGKKVFNLLSEKDKRSILDNNEFEIDGPLERIYHPTGEEKDELSRRRSNQKLKRSHKYIDTHLEFGEQFCFFPVKYISDKNTTSYNILKELWDDKKFLLDNDIIHEHSWSTDDLVLMDQFYTQHKRNAFKGERLLYHFSCFYK